MKDIFDVQDEIAKAIAERLRVTLVGRADARLVAKATVNLEAYQMYLKGRALLYRRGKSIPVALEQFQKAVDLDPGGVPDVVAVHCSRVSAGGSRGRRAQAGSRVLARRAWDQRDPYFLLHARYNPVYRWFRDQPEFVEILREMDAPREG